MLNYPLRFLRLATAYKAKLLCSGIFVSQRNPQSILREDLGADELAPLRLIPASIDRDRQTITTSIFGKFQRTAVYRPGLGSTLLVNATPEQLHQQSQSFTHWHQQNPPIASPLPIAPSLPCELHAAKLNQALDQAFADPHRNQQQRTRAIVILYQGQIIAERYAPGFFAETPLLGWSMTKSVISTLIGVLVKDGKLSLQSQDLLPEWRQSGDPRRSITLDQLLRMSSGLQFAETYSDPRSDVTTMLFQQDDAAGYVANLPAIAPPNAIFSYASGTTVLLSRIIREAIGGSLLDYWTFPRRALFDRLGMASAVLEPDAAGTFIGSSFMYATARDWAKLGLLYLQDGIWQGEQILPPDWVRYSTKPTAIAPDYAAHWWRQVPNSFTAKQGRSGLWPEDAYLASGYQGQFVTVVPSQELVVVRLGLAQRSHSWDHEAFIRQIAQAVKPANVSTPGRDESHSSAD